MRELGSPFLGRSCLTCRAPSYVHAKIRAFAQGTLGSVYPYARQISGLYFLKVFAFTVMMKERDVATMSLDGSVELSYALEVQTLYTCTSR